MTDRLIVSIIAGLGVATLTAAILGLINLVVGGSALLVWAVVAGFSIAIVVFVVDAMWSRE